MSTKTWRRIALAALFAFAVSSTHSVEAVLSELSDKKGTVKIAQDPDFQTTSSATFADIPSMSVTIKTAKEGLLLVRYAAEGHCIDGPDLDTECVGGVQITVDGTPVGPSLGPFFVQTLTGNSGIQSHAIERAVDVLTKSEHEVRAQFKVYAGTDSFSVFNSQLTVQAFK